MPDPDQNAPVPAVQPPSGPSNFIVVTGLSGAGKSTVLQVLEDLHFFTADGLPPDLVPEFATLRQRPGMEHFRGMGLGLDFRKGISLRGINEALSRIPEPSDRPALLFLEATPEALMRRYATTRRPHPLEKEGMGLGQSMAEERRRLASVRAAADFIIDTSTFTLHDLRREIQHRWGGAATQAHAMRINLISFGFKYGVPAEADIVFDARFLPNPHFVDELRPMTGLERPIVEYVFSTEEARQFRKKFMEFMLYVLPHYDAEGRYRLSLAVGCTGGKHRSVALIEGLAQELRQAGYSVSVEHRHSALDKS